MTWLDQARELSAADVAARLGFEVRRGPSAAHTKCPACGAQRRHPGRHDRRGAVGIPHARPNTWHCFACEAGGDSVDFVAHFIGRARFRELDSRRKREVCEWFEREPRVWATHIEYRRWAPAPVAAAYPPHDQVRSLCAAGLAVHRDGDTAEYLAFREIDARVVFEQQLAIALTRAALPDWARLGERSWTATGHRLIVPLFDGNGRLRSVLARSVERAPQLKSAAPRGFGRAGLIMANRHALAMLRAQARPDMVLIREGEIDYLAEAVARPHHAVLGVISGSWCDAIARTIPDAATVVIATDADLAGDKYAETIAASLYGRVRLERRREAA